MNKSTVFIIALFCLVLQKAKSQQFVLQEDFEQGIPSSFMLFDQDGLKAELTFPENTAWTTWTDPDDNENTVAASTSFYSPAGSASDWMVLPMLELPDDPASCQLFWRSRSAYDTYKDGYVVLLSEQTQISPEQLIKDDNSWKTILQVPNSQNPASWKTFFANLSEYAGKKVYIAFVNNTYDGWMLFLDDITVGPRESVRKASVSLTTEHYASDGQLQVTANVKAGILPENKLDIVKDIQSNGSKKVLFTGDGINDAPALTQADIGVAMGNGTDIAMESGDVVVMEGDLENVVAAVQFSKKVMRRIKENIFWAFAYNSILIPVAAGVLYPNFGIMFKPELAGLAMALSSVTVISLSLLLKRYVPPIKRVKN